MKAAHDLPSTIAPPSRQPCPHFPDCVGCALIGTPYGEQLRRKRDRVVQALAGYPSLAGLSVPEVIGSPRAFGYRNRAKLVVRRARRGLLLGIYRPGTHQVVDVRQCPVHHPLINRVLAGLAQLIDRYDVQVYDERTRAGTLRYVVVRVSNWTKRAQVIVVTAARNLPHARELARAVRALHGVVSVVQNVNPTSGNVILSSEFITLGRDTGLVERVGSLMLKTHAGAFLQANTAVARKLYEHALRRAAPQAGDYCVDLYSGVGGLTFSLATQAKLVIGIEESPVAVRDAKENVRLNGFSNVRFECGTAAALLPPVHARLGRVDVVTLNPPRKGVDAATRVAVIACAPRRVVYVSCDADTLARDLDWFAARGWQTVDIQPFDMLPQTEHVECVAVVEPVLPSDSAQV